MSDAFDSLQSEAPVPENGALTRSILESTPHCIAVLNDELKLIYGNQNFFRFAESVFGKELKTGLSLLDVLPDDRKLRWQMRFQEIFSGQCTRVEEVMEVNGETRYFDVAYQPLNEGKQWDKVVVYFEEITVRKRREKRFQDREKEMEEALVTRETLLSVISHDLRSPIFQLNGLLFLIKQASESRDEARLQMQAEDLEERISHLTHTLDNLLSWSNLQRQSLDPQVTRFPLKSVFDHAVGILKPIAQRKGVRIYTQKVRSIDLVSDREMVAFIVRNLVSNAIKFSMQNGKIEVSASEADGMVRFAITDHGVGVEPRRIQTLKEGTHYFSEAGTWGERGTGIGLRTCYEFALRLNGNIDFQSDPGKGSRVVVILPQMDLP